MRTLFVLVARLTSLNVMFALAGANAVCVGLIAMHGNWWFIANAIAVVVCWRIGMLGIFGILSVARDTAFFLAATGRVKLTIEGDRIKVEYVEVPL